MTIKSKKLSAFLYVLLIALMLGAGAGPFVRHVEQIRSKAESTFTSRNELLKKFVAMRRDQVSVMRNLMIERYQSHGPRMEGGFEFREHPEQKVWELVTDPSRVAGTLTGKGPLPSSDEIRDEMRAALGIDAQVRAAQEFSSEIVWFYYLSASGFVYLAPRAPVDQFHFTPELYQQRYWLEAGPQANPARRIILAGPYEDLAGEGWMLTFADPVYAGEKFLGVIALDLRIDTLRELIRLGEATGESMLISENDRLIARESGFEPGVRLHPPVSNKLIDWREDASGDLWLSSPVVKDELWLVHRVKPGEIYRAAAMDSAPAWLLILLFGLVVVMAWRLKGALVEVTRMTHIDPLTQALNRRGFYERADAMLALGKRKKNAIAVLIMDIDFFKKINDTHGHSVGDSVLKQLGGHLLKACRPFDLVCRWGGEEFVLVFLLDNAKDTAAVAERMRQEAQRTRIESADMPVTLSGGLVLMKQDESIDDAIKRADLLLYQAKSSGRNRIVSDEA
jgi:diguanylate cyclase (GGDEF)-like protein